MNPITAALLTSAFWLAFYLMERRRDRRIIATQEKLIAEQAKMIMEKEVALTTLKRQAHAAANAHQRTIIGYENLLNLDRAEKKQEPRPDIDEVVDENRAKANRAAQSAAAAAMLGADAIPTTLRDPGPPADEPPAAGDSSSGG